MTNEEYLKKRLDRINQNSHYGIMIDTEITDIVRSHIKRLEENEMKATSVQSIENVKEMHFTIERSCIDEITKVIVGVSTNDDIFEFHFSGDGCVVFADQWFNAMAYKEDVESERIKRKMMETENSILRKTIKELEDKNKQLKQEIKDDNTKILQYIRINHKLQDENEELKKDLALEKAANEAQHKFIREYAGKGTEVQFNYAIDDTKEVSYVIVDKEEYNKKNEDLLAKVYRLSEENKKLKQDNEEPADNVNHPSHYTGRYECIDVMQDVFGDEATNDFCLCNAFKYIWRANKKNGLEDVKKAVWYLNK